jgi:hypothetical protein
MKGIAKADKARTLSEALISSTPGQHFRLVGDHSHGLPPKRAKPITKLVA